MDDMSVSRESTGRRIGTYGLAIGFFYTVNFSVGIGFLNLPRSFYNAGVLVSCITLAVIAFFNVVTTIWLVETMSRAQALEYSGKMITHSFLDNSDNQNLLEEIDDEKQEDDEICLPTMPEYVIRSDRKFDGPEMCEIFLGKIAKYIYLGIMVLGVFMDLWIKGTVAATAWSSNIPLNVGIFEKCTRDNLENISLHPEGKCWNNYSLCILLYALIVVPLSCLELSEQKWFQVVLSVMRLLLIFSIIIYCVVMKLMGSSPVQDESDSDKAISSNHWIGGSLVGWLAAIPVFAFTQSIQVNIPTLTQPIEPKRKLRGLYTSALLTLTVLYVILGVVVTAFFQSSVDKTLTLNWEPLTSPEHNVFLRIWAYFVVLFPSFDVTSAFPLGVTVLTNVIHSALGHDTPQNSLLHSRSTRVVYRLVFALIPLIGATFITELETLLRYEGLLTYIVFWVFPALMQYSSMKMCRKVFGLQRCVSQSISKTRSDVACVISVKPGDELETPYSTRFSNNWMVGLALLFACFLISASIAGIILK